jgi:hypothetical protein
MALSASALYYRRNKKARDKKKRYDSELNSSEAQTTKRVESNRARRRAKRKGQNIEGKDYDHHENAFISVKRNRGRRNEGNR